MFILCLLFIFGSVDTQGLVGDPCEADNHEAFLYDRLGSRNEICEVGPTLGLCDYYLKDGWYIEEHSVILNHCPLTGSCGVVFPAWMQGTFPRIEDGIVNRTVCMKDRINGIVDCCADQLEMQIKNCTSFLVYYLPHLPECDHAYCFESNFSCDEPKLTTSTATPDGQDKTVTSKPIDNTKYILIGIAVGVGVMTFTAAVVLAFVFKTGSCKRTSRSRDQAKTEEAIPNNPPPYENLGIHFIVKQ